MKAKIAAPFLMASWRSAEEEESEDEMASNAAEEGKSAVVEKSVYCTHDGQAAIVDALALRGHNRVDGRFAANASHHSITTSYHFT